VAETQAALANNFENPLLMRKLGLILENVDGTDNLATKFVMRGVPHTRNRNMNQRRLHSEMFFQTPRWRILLEMRKEVDTRL
jgi:hypothetical protein